MTEPRRWADAGNAPAGVLELLGKARPSRPLDPATKERSRQRLARLAALPAAAGTVLWLQHAAYGAVLGAAVTGAVTIGPRVLSSHRSEVPAPSARMVGSGPLPRVAARGSLAGPEVSAAAEAPKPFPAKAAPAARFEATEHELSREAKSLEHARTLVSSRPLEALAALRRHRIDFPRGTLEVECEFLEVEAYVRLGRRAEAEASARVLRQRAPGSLYEGRLERLMANDR